MTGLFTRCCIDTSALVDLYRQSLRDERDLELWALFESDAATGCVVSNREVRKELRRGSNGLAKWAVSHGAFFVDPDAYQVELLQKVLEAKGSHAVHLDRQHKYDADPWLAAQGAACGLVVVTCENPRRAHSVPSMCSCLGVEWAHLREYIQVLRGEREPWPTRMCDGA